MNPNRRTRRELGARAQPAADLVATRPPASPYVFVGVLGGGAVRLRPGEARAFVDQLLELVDQADALDRPHPPPRPGADRPPSAH